MTTYSYTTIDPPGSTPPMATSDLSLFQLDQNDGLFPTGESQLALNSYLIGKGDTTGLTDPTTIVVQSDSDTSAVAFAPDAAGKKRHSKRIWRTWRCRSSSTRRRLLRRSQPGCSGANAL
jgi:hypothetical protein